MLARPLGYQHSAVAKALDPEALRPRILIADAFILASATPHNGRKESFAELIRLLDPTAVSADGDINTERLPGLVIRRHRHNPEVAPEVGGEWAERLPPDRRLVDASGLENAVADELVKTWLHPASGKTPSSGAGTGLFGWTLSKAFLSSPAALRDAVDERLRRIHDGAAGDIARSRVQLGSHHRPTLTGMILQPSSATILVTRSCTGIAAGSGRSALTVGSSAGVTGSPRRQGRSPSLSTPHLVTGFSWPTSWLTPARTALSLPSTRESSTN